VWLETARLGGSNEEKKFKTANWMMLLTIYLPRLSLYSPESVQKNRVPKAAAGQETEIACSCLNRRRRRRPISRRRRPRLSTLMARFFCENFIEVHRYLDLAEPCLLFPLRRQVPTQCQEMASAADAELQIS
jgi:hypothetical protein